MIEVGLVFLFTLLIGSFLNVVIYRIPKGESIMFPASHCGSCNTPLKWWHNIPVLSWIMLRGRCGFCDAKISARYPAVEILTGLLGVAIYAKLGFVWYMPFVFVSFASLLALSMIDFDYMAVPDSVNITALVFALVQTDFIGAIINATVAAGGLFLLGFIASKLAKREAMGSADIIVAGTMGALLGFPLFFVALFLSAILALIPSLIWRENGVPFVPFLALATFIVYIFNNESLNLMNKIIYG